MGYYDPSMVLPWEQSSQSPIWVIKVQEELMMLKTLTPEDLANKLVAPLKSTMSIPKPLTQIPFDLEMLHKAYFSTKEQTVGKTARNAFLIALKGWTDVEIKDFLCKWLFEPPYSIQLAKVSAEKRRELFEKVFQYIFAGKDFIMPLE